MSTIFNYKLIALVIFTIGAFSVDHSAQSCGLAVEPSLAESDTVIKGASATAVSRTTSLLVRSSFRQGFPYFADLPEGKYLVTVKKAGFKQTVDEVDHSCEGAEEGVASAFVSMWKGASTQKVDVSNATRKRMEVFTVVGDPDLYGKVVQNPAGSGTSASRVPKTVSGGILNGKAINLPMPEYPAAARAVSASGAVSVQVLIDEEGNTVSASAVSGHPLLRAAAESAARNATFSRTLISGQPVKVSGVLVYNFVP